MPIFNCATTIRQSIRSILLQTYENWELIIIDDGSIDDTLLIASQFRDKRIKIWGDGGHMALPARLNQAIEKSLGKYFARMDSDDVSYPDRLERQVEYLEQHAEVDLVGTDMVIFGENGKLIGKRNCPENHAAICRRPTGGFPLFHPTLMGRLTWFKLYQYDGKIERCEDQDLYLRAYEKSLFGNIPEVLFGYREGSLAWRKIIKSRRDFVRAFAKRYCAKRRSGLNLASVVAEQFLKGTIDFLAIKTGLNHRLLRHRAQPCFTKEENERWTQVWNSVN